MRSQQRSVTSVHGQRSLLFGRDEELGLIDRLVAGIAETHVLGFFGPPGVGKTALLAAASETARRAHQVVIRAGGSPVEAAVPCAIFSQLSLQLERAGGDRHAVKPSDDQATSLTTDEGDRGAEVGLRLLGLLEHAADAGDILVLIDDLHPLDDASADALRFVIRHLQGSRVRMILTGAESERWGGLSEVASRDVQRLSRSDAAAMLLSRHPNLPIHLRRTILTASAGLPLAIRELPLALGPRVWTSEELPPRELPMTEALAAPYRNLLFGLTTGASDAVLVAAVADSTDLSIVATAVVDGVLEGIAEAERAEILTIGGDGVLRFRDPLMRLAVLHLASPPARRAAHRAVAAVVSSDLEAHGWHLAHASTSRDDTAADALQRAAQSAVDRGEVMDALAALIRSAELTTTSPRRGRRTLEALVLAASLTGDAGTVGELEKSARRIGADMKGLLAATAQAWRLVTAEGDLGGAAHSLVDALGASDATASRDDRTRALQVLVRIAHLAPTDQARADLRAVVGRQPKPLPPLLLQSIEMISTGAEAGTVAMLEQGAALATPSGGADVEEILDVAVLATSMDRLAECRSDLRRVARDQLEAGAVLASIRATCYLVVDGLRSGSWREAEQRARDGVDLAETHGHHYLALRLRGLRAQVLAHLGQEKLSAIVRDEAVAGRAAHSASDAAGILRRVELIEALQNGRDAVAGAIASIYAGHPFDASTHDQLLMLDVVEALLNSQRSADLSLMRSAFAAHGTPPVSTRTALLRDVVEAMLGNPIDLVRLVDESLGRTDPNWWLFERGRALLITGSVCREQGDAEGAGRRLRDAEAIFTALGAGGWLRRTRRELRAIDPARVTSHSLSAQELRIASMAAAGLSNREIARELALSVRTVSNYLYRIFPKLDVRSRAALRDALTESGEQLDLA